MFSWFIRQQAWSFNVKEWSIHHSWRLWMDEQWPWTEPETALANAPDMFTQATTTRIAKHLGKENMAVWNRLVRIF